MAINCDSIRQATATEGQQLQGAGRTHGTGTRQHRQQAQWPETQILDTGTPELDRNAGISHRVASTAVMVAEDRLDVGDTRDARIGARAVKTGCAIIYL